MKRINIKTRQKRPVVLRRRRENIGRYNVPMTQLINTYQGARTTTPIGTSTGTLTGTLTEGRGIGVVRSIKVIAKKNHRITEEQLKSIKMDIMTPKGLTEGRLLKLFKIYVTIIPNKILTNKGVLVRMGRGKAKPKTSVFYLTPGYPSILLVPNTNLQPGHMPLVHKLLKKFILRYSFFTFKDTL